MKVDDAYSKRIDNIVRNLKFLVAPSGNEAPESFKEFCDRMMVKKTVNIFKLISPHP